MADLVPPRWLILWSVVCYGLWAVFSAGQLFFGEVPDADVGSAGGIKDTIDAIWSFVTFDPEPLGFELHGLVRGFLFLTCTVPWFFVMAAGIIEAIKALGVLIPFTMVVCLLAVAGPSLAASGDVATFHPDGDWQSFQAARICAVAAPTAAGVLTAPDGSQTQHAGDSEGCWAFQPVQAGTYNLTWADAGGSQTVFFEVAHGWLFYGQLVIFAAVLLVGVLDPLYWTGAFAIAAIADLLLFHYTLLDSAGTWGFLGWLIVAVFAFVLEMMTYGRDET